MSYGHWKPYVPVAERRAKGILKVQQMAEKQGITPQPVTIQGRKITKTFWGTAWCDHLESYADLANRLDRGRTYVRNGSVCHLDILEGNINAMVSGSEPYSVRINITKLSVTKWRTLKKKCTGKINSLLSLLQGKLPENILETVTDKQYGLFPAPDEIKLRCDCPDGAYMCKHLAAVLYGIGARLDTQPELLFTLRGIDHNELISSDIDLDSNEKREAKSSRRRIADTDLSDVFGVEMADSPLPARRPSKAKKPIKKKAAAKKTAKKKAAKLFDPTGLNVAKLRKKFSMTHIEFALLLGVSTQTIHNWETKPGKLTLRSHSKEALFQASKYTAKKAWEKMGNL